MQSVFYKCNCCRPDAFNLGIQMLYVCANIKLAQAGRCKAPKAANVDS